MGLCKFCKKWLHQIQGKKKKEFCNSTCRSNYWYQKNKKITHEEPAKETNAETEAEPLSFDKLKQNIIIPEATNDFIEQMNKANDIEELEAVGRKIKSSGMTWKEQQYYHEYGKMVAKKKFID